MTIASSVRPGATVRPAPLLPLLVLESDRPEPLWPLLVASTLASIVTVFAVFVTAVVANVAVAVGSTAACASEERYTSATPGAGTVIKQVFAVVSQLTVSMTSVPVRRPSASKRPPKVCRRHDQP